MLARELQRLRNADRVAVAAADHHVQDRVTAAAHAPHGEPPLARDVRHAAGSDRDDQHLLGQRVGVLDQAAQRQWRRLAAGVEEDRAFPVAAADGGFTSVRQSRNSLRSPSLRMRLRVTITCPARQVIITTEATTADRERQPGAVEASSRRWPGRTRPRRSGTAAEQRQPPLRRLPQRSRRRQEQDRVEDERAGHGDPVGVGEVRSSSGRRAPARPRRRRGSS